VSQTVTIPLGTLESWAISAVRYALGRRTYIVSDTAWRLRAVWQHLRAGTREVILRDVREALGAADRGLSIGDDCDREEWRDLVEWIEGRLVQP